MSTIHRIRQNKIVFGDPIINNGIYAGTQILFGQTVGATSVSLTHGGDAVDDSVESINIAYNSICSIEGQLSVKYNYDLYDAGMVWNVRAAVRKDAYTVSIIQSQLTEIGFNNLSLSAYIKPLTQGIQIVGEGIAGVTIDWFAMLNFQFSKSIN